MTTKSPEEEQARERLEMIVGAMVQESTKHDDAMRQHLDDAQILATALRNSYATGSEKWKHYRDCGLRISVARWGC